MRKLILLLAAAGLTGLAVSLPVAPAQAPPAKGEPGNLTAYAGTWSANFKEFGETQKRYYFFNQDGIPVWRGTVMKKPGQILAKIGRDSATLVSLSLSPKQVEYTLRFYFSITDANRVERFVFRPIPGAPDRLHFEHWEHRRNQAVLKFSTELKRN